MGKKIDITGKKYGRLEVVSKAEGKTMWLCKCDCGNLKIVKREYLTKGETISCGCYATEVRKTLHRTHGKSKKGIYNIWAGIKARCYNENNEAYPDYGGRGIVMQEEWRFDFQKFYDDMIEGYEPGLTIERIDVNKGYFKDNLTWIPRSMQASNTRRNVRLTHKGETMIVRDWAIKLGVRSGMIYLRLRRGLPIEEVLSPVIKKNQHG